jgi:type II secretory pathway pseudopilin PulG
MEELMDVLKLRTQRECLDEGGMTLVETLIGVAILAFGLLMLAQVLAFSVVAGKTYGRNATAATIAAHDKMEELILLNFTDTSTNVTVAPPFPASGVGLTAGGSIPPAAPVDGYSDYLDATGVRTAAAGAVYTRQWQIFTESANLKRIVVVVTNNKNFKYGKDPSTTLITYKSK